MRRRFLLLGCTAVLGGCISVELKKPIEIHAVVDVNVKVDRELKDFFGDIDKKSATIATPHVQQ
jgi:hypothetical protein